MNVARVVYFSDRLDTYADSVIAILHDFPEVKRIELVFTDGSLAPKVDQEKNSAPQPTIGEEQERIASAIRSKISSAADSHPAYMKAKNVPIVPFPIAGRELYPVLRTASVVDVSGTPKEMAINLVTAAIAQGKTPVCSLRWLGKIDRRKTNRIGTDPYHYERLTELREAKRLGRYFRANVFIVYFIAVSVLLLAIVSFLSYWVPQFKIASQVMSSLGVIIGFASLWLATRATRED